MKLFENGSSNFVIVYGSEVQSVIVPYIKHLSRVMKVDFNLYMPCFDEYALSDVDDTILNRLGKSVTNGSLKNNNPIIINSRKSKVCSELMDSLDNDSYAIKIENDKIYIAYSSNFAALYVLDRFEKEYFIKDTPELPSEYLVKETVNFNNLTITTTIPQQRDPFVQIVDGVHYLYGTKWRYWKNTAPTVKSYDTWEGPFNMVNVPEDAEKDFWAPEVHFYKGNYYIFTAFYSKKSKTRGVHIFKSSSPEGPFEEISNGSITDPAFDNIDGTLYIDENNQPWMFYCPEWTSTADGLGKMAAVKLSDDLSKTISEPVELFSVDDCPLCISYITDGPEIYKMKTGELLMLWASDDESGYMELVSRSKSGNPLGPWEEDYLIYSSKLSESYPGGHGMIFTDTDGQMYLIYHGPDWKIGDVMETPRLIPLRESAGMFIWDLFKK